MKHFLTVAALGLVGMSALAGELKFDFRADMEGYSHNDAITTPTYNRYYLQTARLDYKGSVDENTSFRARVRLNKDLDKAVSKSDSMNSTVDFFMVKTKLTESLGLGAGRFQGMAGGWENVVPGADIYYKSTALTELSLVGYYSGFSVDTKVAETNTLTLHVANQDTEETSGGKLAQKKSLVAASWEGNFSEGNIKPLVTYTQSPKVGTDLNNTFLSAGVKMKFDDLSADVEYLSNTWAEQSVADKDDVTTSITAALAKKMDLWTAKAKLESSTLNVAGTKASDITGLGLIAEFKPVAEQDLRYHLAVVQKSTKPVAGDTATEQFLSAGLKLNADFLK